MTDRNHYRLLAALFEYPDAQFPHRVSQIRAGLDGDYEEATAKLDKFLEYLPANDVLAMQELFTRSFDVQAIATLDLGYVLFGDDYKRGELLANLSREHTQAKNDCGTELGDHLPNLLRLISRLEDEELLEDLAYAIIAPALTEMIGEFSSERIQTKNKSYKKHYKTLLDNAPVADKAVTLYQYALKALYEVLKKDFPRIEKQPLERDTSDFLGSVAQENRIEENRIEEHVLKQY
jgi:nitrate reductase assembly molybdenum cofactor insertion protein NarJ